MKTLGLIGGMSHESTVHYYQHLNAHVSARLGGFHSAKLLLYSIDFAELEPLQRADKWDEAGTLLANAALNLKAAGAEAIVICANTMHIVAEAVEQKSGLGVLHIADLTAAAVKDKGCKTVGLLGTRYTMEKDFYKRRLEEEHGLEVLVPDLEGRDVVHEIVFTELVKGVVRDESRRKFVEIIGELKERGADCVVLGCTEFAMLISEKDSPLPVFDTARIHAEGAAEWALKE